MTFRRADRLAQDDLSGEFGACFAGFWWSHVLRSDIARFLWGLHRRLGHGTRVLFLDNRYVEGSSTPVVKTDMAGNTYQHRRVADGTTHEVLKNFPVPADVRQELVAAGARTVEVVELEYYWYATYET